MLRCKAWFGMNWFRSNIKHGSRLALLALAIQFVLSFGHFHAIAAQAAPAFQQASQQAPSNQDSDQQPADPCAICAVMALANTALAASPPVLLLPQAVELFYLATEAAFVRPDRCSLVFQPRAPPIS